MTPQEENGSGSMICAGGVRWMRSQLSMGVALLGEQGCSKFTLHFIAGFHQEQPHFVQGSVFGINQRIGEQTQPQCRSQAIDLREQT